MNRDMSRQAQDRIAREAKRREQEQVEAVRSALRTLKNLIDPKDPAKHVVVVHGERYLDVEGELLVAITACPGAARDLRVLESKHTCAPPVAPAAQTGDMEPDGSA